MPKMAQNGQNGQNGPKWPKLGPNSSLFLYFETEFLCMDSKKAPEKHGDVHFAKFLANKICINFLCPK